MKEPESFLLDLLPKGVVIGNDERHVDVQLTGAPAPEHVGKAVVLATHQQDGPQRLCLVADVPIGIDLDRDLGEVPSYRIKGRPLPDLKGETRKKPSVECVGVLMDLGEVSTLSGHEAGDPGKETDPVGTVQRDEERAGGTHDGFQGRRSVPSDHCLPSDSTAARISAAAPEVWALNEDQTIFPSRIRKDWRFVMPTTG